MSAQQLRNLELVSALPQKDGKPDKGVYDLLQEGKTRQRIWQRIEDKACIRCGSSDHLRADCPQSEKNWEEDFNKGRVFWEKPKLKKQQRVQASGLTDLLFADALICKPFSPSCIRVGIGTMSNVDTCREDLLLDMEAIRPVKINGTGGSILAKERGYLPLQDPNTGAIFKLPFLAVSSDHLPEDCACIIGLSTVRQCQFSLDRCLQHQRPILRIEEDSPGQIRLDSVQFSPEVFQAGPPSPVGDSQDLSIGDLPSLARITALLSTKSRGGIIFTC